MLDLHDCVFGFSLRLTPLVRLLLGFTERHGLIAKAGRPLFVGVSGSDCAVGQGRFERSVLLQPDGVGRILILHLQLEVGLERAHHCDAYATPTSKGSILCDNPHKMSVYRKEASVYRSTLQVNQKDPRM